MRPRVLSISPYAAGDPNLVALSQQPSALAALTLTATPLVFDTPRTVLFTFADGPVDAAIAEDGGVFTDETTEANEATSDDMTLFPAVPAAGVDRYNIGAESPFGRVDFDISTVGTGTYTVVFEYFNGTSFVALSGVVDGTTNFKTSGLNSVSFTIPSDWAETTIDGQGPFFFIRAEIQAGTVTAVPLGEQAFLGGTAAGNRFLITGQDSKGNQRIESVVGAAAAATAESGLVFTRVDSIVPERSGDGLLEVGTLTAVPTPWLPLDYLRTDFQASLGISVGAATADLTAQLTLSNLLARRGNDPQPGVGSWVGSEFGLTFPEIVVFDHSSLVNITADTTGNLDFPVRAVRLISNAVLTGDDVQMEVVQASHGG